MGTPAIGGKDSMSGSFGEMTVPPTLISFAVSAAHVDSVITSELKSSESLIQLFKLPRNEQGIPDLEETRKIYDQLVSANQEGKILSAKVIGIGGIAEALAKMAFGNGIGVTINEQLSEDLIFEPLYGSILIESLEILEGSTPIGETNEEEKLSFGNEELPVSELAILWEAPLQDVYPQQVESPGVVKTISFTTNSIQYKKDKVARPQVFIPVFPGTNCEFDTAKAFENAGAKPVVTIFRNQSTSDILASIDEMVKNIGNSQMIMIPGGFSAGDQPNGSGKFIASVFRNPQMMDAVMELLNNRDGLMLGICNGFQALIKLGLVPNGEICEITADMPTLTFNTINRHISTIPMTRISSNLSPWLANTRVGEIHRIPMSHGEGRFVASDDVMESLIENGQIATQYVDFSGEATMDGRFNPNGSVYGVEGITSQDGRVLGKMGHSERIGKNLYKNIPGNTDQQIFKAGVDYFK
jgi:phosphoribosylformylglycinamidine synthase